MSFSLEDELPQALCQALRGDRCVLYTGSGFSIPAGLPSFAELLVHVARDGGLEDVKGDEAKAVREVQALGKDGMFAKQGDIVSALGKQKAGELFKQHLQPASPLPAEIVSRLDCVRRTNFALVVTQNWDNLLEQSGYKRCVPEALNDYTAPLAVLREAVGGKQKKERRDTAVKFESDGGTAASWLLSSAEIELVSNEGAAPKGSSGYAFWSTLLEECTVVFAGCSIDGGYLGKMLRATKSEARPQHFAIMGNVVPEARQQYEVELGVTVLGYSFRAEEGHPAGALTAYIERLCDASTASSL